ncbi:uncharacterized protein BJ171DRAFT_632238 [Polychytrium aggregatum]|uniref:uncharacterized protein n=1 Tax=Polychytrium aggregatum TaxID=110093 RepID=UPI0022FE1E11|nr:uncharacterized protein BJ171DRAFT_632238 [Polychytrium aggregatum]KAI9199297.1 hypothetical protein BJ171DRAFT_632238 [Polychytrium aggregatum]
MDSDMRLGTNAVLYRSICSMMFGSATRLLDFIQKLYLDAIRGYVPKETTEKVAIPDKFTVPAPPPKPELETAPARAVQGEEAFAEEEWPALYNAIDDPHNYNDEWDFTTDNDDGALLPQRLKPVDYDAHH